MVDLRWGSTENVTNKHLTKETCLKEIENCMCESAGPYFVVDNN